jgi:hypothetical protein
VHRIIRQEQPLLGKLQQQLSMTRIVGGLSKLNTFLRVLPAFRCRAHDPPPAGSKTGAAIRFQSGFGKSRGLLCCAANIRKKSPEVAGQHPKFMAGQTTNKVHGFSTDRSVSFALCSVSSCRTRGVNGTKKHYKQRIGWWAL